MSVATKLVPVADGVVGTPIELRDGRIVSSSPSSGDVLQYNSTSGKYVNTPLPHDILSCSMLYANDEAYMSDGTTVQQIEDALDGGQVVICTLLFGSSGYVILSATESSPLILTGSQEFNSQFYMFKATYDHTDSGTGYDYWNLQYTSIPTNASHDVISCSWNGTTVTGKTPQEIYNAVQDEKVVVCESSSAYLYCVYAYQSGNSYNIKFSQIAKGSNHVAIFLNYDGSSWSYSQINIQEQLVGSGTGQNIKTINGTSLLGSGDIDTSELPALTNNGGKVLAVNSVATGVEWVAQQGGSVTVDAALSETSMNPVQNKAINVLTRKLWQKVDIVSRLGDEYPTTRNQISNGVWSSSTTYKHWAVPVDGLRLVSVTANNSQFAILTFLKTYNSTSGTPDYATGYSGNTTVDAGKTKLFNVPSDANYMIIMSGSSNARKPSNVLLTGVAINHPALGYINMASNASSCNITLTDTKQSFIIDNSANGNVVSVAVTTQVTSIYSHRMLAVDKNSISQFDFEITETGQNTILSVMQQVLYDQT